MSFPHSSVGKESTCNAGDLDSIPGSGRFPGEENGNPLQYSCLENPVDRGAQQATVHGVARLRHELAMKPPPPHMQGNNTFFFFLAVLSLRCYAGFLQLQGGGPTLQLQWLASPHTGLSCCRAQAQQLWYMDLVAPCRVESSQISNLTHVAYIGRGDALPLSHQESPEIILLKILKSYEVFSLTRIKIYQKSYYQTCVEYSQVFGN